MIEVEARQHREALPPWVAWEARHVGASFFMHGVCDRIRAELAECLKNSDCMRVQGHSAKECMSKYRDTLPTECQQVYHGFVDCKRSLWDMRKRFRGIPGGQYNSISTMFAALDRRMEK